MITTPLLNDRARKVPDECGELIMGQFLASQMRNIPIYWKPSRIQHVPVTINSTSCEVEDRTHSPFDFRSSAGPFHQ
jgi:hypothetical protein